MADVSLKTRSEKIKFLKGLQKGNVSLDDLKEPACGAICIYDKEAFPKDELPPLPKEIEVSEGQSSQVLFFIPDNKRGGLKAGSLFEYHTIKKQIN